MTLQGVDPAAAAMTVLRQAPQLPAELLLMVFASLARHDLEEICKVNKYFELLARPFFYRHGFLTRLGPQFPGAPIRYPFLNMPELGGPEITDDELQRISDKVERLDIKPHVCTDCDFYEALCESGADKFKINNNLRLKVFNIETTYRRKDDGDRVRAERTRLKWAEYQHPKHHDFPRIFDDNGDFIEDETVRFCDRARCPTEGFPCRFYINPNTLRGSRTPDGGLDPVEVEKLVIRNASARFRHDEIKLWRSVTCAEYVLVVNSAELEVKSYPLGQCEEKVFNWGFLPHLPIAVHTLTIVFWTAHPGTDWVPDCGHFTPVGPSQKYIVPSRCRALDKMWKDLSGLIFLLSAVKRVTLVNVPAVIEDVSNEEIYAYDRPRDAGPTYFEERLRDAFPFPGALAKGEDLREVDLWFPTMEEWIATEAWEDVFTRKDIEPFLEAQG